MVSVLKRSMALLLFESNKSPLTSDANLRKSLGSHGFLPIHWWNSEWIELWMTRIFSCRSDKSGRFDLSKRWCPSKGKELLLVARLPDTWHVWFAARLALAIALSIRWGAALRRFISALKQSSTTLLTALTQVFLVFVIFAFYPYQSQCLQYPFDSKSDFHLLR